VRRRDFIAVLGGAAVALPLNARPQPLDKTRRIGVLMGLADGDPEGQSGIAALREGLKELGWSEGRNLVIDLRWSGGDANRMRVLAAELVSLRPNVIVGHSTGSTNALRQATDTIPIVFIQVSDPIGSGFITSLASPGGNLTGFSMYERSMGGKWLEILKEIAPAVKRVALMFNPQTAPYVPRYYLSSFQEAAQQFNVELITMPVRSPAEIEDTIKRLAQRAGGGLAFMPDTFLFAHRELIVGLVTKHQLPAISSYRSYTTGGGLVSYGVDIPDLFRRSATYVDHILKGEKPSDLPVQQPTKFELVINLDAAKALGLTVPPLLLAEADEVIE
jgi:putative ABC transport system substrate-binding protein